MELVFGPVGLGVLLIALGFCNMRGNISTIHWYHRRRIAEEDKAPFGRMIGIGTVVAGASVLAFGGLALLAQKTGRDVYTLIGSAVVLAGCVLGVGISLYAIIKYNKSLF